MPTNWPPSFLGLDTTNTTVPSSDSRAAYDAIQLARKRRSADHALNLGLDTSVMQGKTDEKHSQLQRVSKLWGTLRQRCSRCASTGGRKNVRRYVAVTVLVLLIGADVMVGSKIFKTARQTYLSNVSPREKLTQLLGAGALVGSKVSDTARQIYMRNLSPKEQLDPPEEQLAQSPLPPRTSKTTPHRNQAAVNKQPGEQLPNLQTTAEQAGSASQGGILERLLTVPNERGSSGIQGDPHARVWVDTHTGVYLCQGTVGFGKTSRGRYMTQQQARFDGFRPAYEKKCE